ncbi:MAG: glycosyltransferase, partial [Ignavibacteriaceae bacterium]
VYGTDMYKTIAKSKVVLNVHANSSPRFASNMRLFETTGVGTCLLTDWKENLPSLFNEAEEIVSYKNDEECIEKTEWLLKNKNEYLNVGKRGQKRTLEDHTYDSRVENLLSIINKNLK